MMSYRTWSQTAFAIVISIVQVALGQQMLANTNRSAQWNVQVETVDPGDVQIEPAFTAAIYENLIDELGKSKEFKQVFRSGDRNASNLSDLLVLRTTVQAYTPGSETKRAVTTVTGATKLKVRSQLMTRDGQMVMERTLDGSVHFFGSNLRVTHNLARNIAKAIVKSNVPDSAPSVSKQ